MSEHCIGPTKKMLTISFRITSSQTGKFFSICVDSSVPCYRFQLEKVGYPWESTRHIYQHIPPIYGLYNGCIGQDGVIFGEQLLGYPAKGTQHFPLKVTRYANLSYRFIESLFSKKIDIFREDSVSAVPDGLLRLINKWSTL